MKKDFTVVTSFAVRDWETYGKRFIKSFIEFWPKTVKLLCYCDGFPMPEDAPQVENIEYIDLLDNKDLIEFKERNKQFNGTLPKQVYNFYNDVIKFCHKVYAQSMAVNKCETEWLLWLDADSVTYEPVGVRLLERICNSQYDIIYLGRKDIYATCSSFIGYNLNSDVTPVFMDDYVNYYNSDEVLKLKCFADNYVFDRIRIIHEAHGMRSLNLTPDCKILEAFELCELSKCVIHLKGNKKHTSKNVRITGGRYHDLFNIVDHYKRKNILEVGTWNGETACGMIIAAFQNSNEVHYTGIDLFEDADEVSDKKEFNVKAHYSKKAVELKLEALAKEFELEDKKLTFHLIKGDSKEKLSILKDKSLCKTYNIFPDFAFIDGGHDYETVKHDFYGILKIADEKITILFDDYIDKPKFGICKLVDEEIDPIFKTDLITTFSNWHPVHKANKIHSTSNMIIIDSSTAEAPLESLFDKIEIEYFLKAYRRKIRLQRKIRKIKSFIPPILYHPIKTVSGIILRSKIVQSTIKPIWHWFKRK